MFVYRISSLSTNATSVKYGTQSCMEINVTNGIFGQQYNYWHADKGQVLVSGIGISQDLNESNVRNSESSSPFIPGLHI
ncbi:MAG: hypothetical protein H7282_14580 [Cytophagaceae bacterium]|nr:hypothetical protein [Cytophagaceae bacterium]